MPTAIPRGGALEGVVPLHQRQPGVYSAQAVEALEANEVSDEELETEYLEAVVLPTIAKQRRAAKPLSSGDHKAELDKLEQKLPCVRWRQMGSLCVRVPQLGELVVPMKSLSRHFGQEDPMWLCVFMDRTWTALLSVTVSIRLHPGQSGRCTIIVKNSEVRMSRYSDTSTKTQLAKIMVKYGRPSCFS